jgi:ribosomal-protein-alanine N-acetyltransferase
MLRVRVATVADIPAIVAIERSVYNAAHWPEAQYKSLLGPNLPGLRSVFLAEDTEAIVAFLVAHRVADTWEIENLAVVQANQRRGIATLLLDALLKSIAGSEVFLEVRESNLAARRFYEESGFAKIGRRKNYYRDPLEDALQYRWVPP